MDQGFSYKRWLEDPSTPVYKSTRLRRKKKLMATLQSHQTNQNEIDDDNRRCEQQPSTVQETVTQDNGQNSHTASTTEIESIEDDHNGEAVFEGHLPRLHGDDDSIEHNRHMSNRPMDDEEEEANDEQPEQNDDVASNCYRNHDVQMKKRPNLEDETLYPGSVITKKQSLHLLQAFSLRHSLTNEAFKDLLKLLNVHHPNIVPGTQYLFQKEMENYRSGISKYDTCELHMYCPVCIAYLGVYEQCQETCCCSSCNHAINAQKLKQDGSFFIVIPLQNQLQDLLENHQTKIRKPGSTQNSEAKSDITDGNLYRECVRAGVLGENDISILWNSDGIPVFHSSGYQLWPIQCQIIELQPSERKEHILLTGLWFGPLKPIMHTFLTPFVKEIKKLESEGFQWRNDGVTVTTRALILVCAADSIARPMLRHTKQFNAFYGCDFCYHPGGGPYIKTHSQPEPLQRTNEAHVEDALKGTEASPHFGVKGPSPLMLLKHFKMVTGFVPDYQHSVCLGVVRQMLHLFLDSENHLERWYIGRKVREIDLRLLSIKPPVEITRTPRSLQHCLQYYKASELRSFLLFYSLPVLKDILHPTYYSHFFLLVYAVSLLLSDHLTEDDILSAKEVLCKFVIQFQDLYHQVNMSFNVHLMSHLADSALNWGPIWATSTFTFESYNGVLLKYFNGTQGVPEQIIKSFLNWRYLRSLGRECFDDDSEVEGDCQVKMLYNSFLGNERLTTLSSEQHPDGVRTFGKPDCREMSVIHKRLIQGLVGNLTFPQAKYYERFLAGPGIIVHVAPSRLKKRNNSVVELSDGRICEVVALASFLPCTHLIHVPCSGDCVPRTAIIAKTLLPVGGSLCTDTSLGISSISVVRKVEFDAWFAAWPMQILRKCVLMEIGDSLFVARLPNNIERD